tara:strand:- start:529 stop:1191 length:663 start_codon:yes stop_codon:yes gene_type:complete
MSKINTVKATATYTLPPKAIESVGELLNDHAAKVLGDNKVAEANAAMGKYMDQFFPIFPLLLGNQGATFAAFTDKADEAQSLRKGFTEQDWVKGMAVLDSMRTQHADHADSESIEFKKVLEGVKNSCKYRVGGKKTEAAIARAKKAKLDIPVKTKGGTGDKGGDDAPSDPMSVARVQCNNLVIALNALADAKGVAGCPDDKERIRLSDLAGQIATALSAK